MDSSSFETIYNLFWEELYDYSLYHCKDSPVAEEIVQDIFLSLWERRDSFIVRADIKSYLYRAVKYKVFDHYREKAKNDLLLNELRLHLCDEHCLTENEVMFNDLNKSLLQIVESLPCRCREVYRLSRESGLNNKEIALALSISEKTVEQHLTKALRFIREKIDERY